MLIFSIFSMDEFRVFITVTDELTELVLDVSFVTLRSTIKH